MLLCQQLLKNSYGLMSDDLISDSVNPLVNNDGPNFSVVHATHALQYTTQYHKRLFSFPYHADQ